MDVATVLGILIVDDDAGDRKSLRRALAKSGLNCDIREADGIPAALSLLDTAPVSCVFVDYNMPVLDGIAGIEQFRQRLPDVPFIMVTGQGDELVATKAIKSGAADYLPKRLVSPGNVRKSLEHVLEVAGLEKRLREQQEALASFSRMLAHDLKAPVRHVGIVSETLEQALADRNFERASELRGMMSKMVDRIGLLVTTLDQYNISLSPNVAFDTQDLRRLLDDALENLQLDIERTGAVITSDVLPVVKGNDVLLIQLLQNLIGNAVKFCRAGEPRVHVSSSEEDEGYKISVRDNGIGIAPEHIQVIFEPFKRLNPVGEFTGSGLGLATCQKILERHGGRIWLESVQGEGTTFHFTLARPDHGEAR